MKSLVRIFALVVRYFYLIKTSFPRILELMYWPTFQMILWGLISKHLTNSNDTIIQIGGVLIAGVLLWDILFRSQLGFSISFLEEIWSRNLGQLFVSPLKPLELVLSLMTISFIRTTIAMIPAALLAIPTLFFFIISNGT
jgi:ABC-2 type transport system permease protein